MRRLQAPFVLLVLILSAILFAGCGGSPAPRRAPVAKLVQNATGHACNPADAVMQCELPPAPSTLQTLTRTRYGLDFGWSDVSAASARAQGASFAASYLSDDPSKDWTWALVHSYHALGISTVAVWETGATRAQDGYAAGVSDATAARSQAAELGDLTGAIDFAIDCDCAPSSTLSYFQGVHHVLGARTGAYGGYDQLGYLSAQHVLGAWNWQTYAWSGGRWLSASIAPLQQYLNGSSEDHDRAIAANFGQWPYSAPKPPPKPSPFAIYPLAKVEIYSQKVSERLTVENWWRYRCENPVRREACVTTRVHLVWLADRIYGLANIDGDLGDSPTGPVWNDAIAKANHWGQRFSRIEKILNGKARR